MINLLSPPRGKFSRVKSITIGSTKLLFVSGIAASIDTPPTVKEQTEQIFKIIEGLLNEHDATLEHIVKLTCYLADINYYLQYNEVRDKLFAQFDKPAASSTVEAKLVLPEFLVEIEAIAVIDN